MKKFLLKTLFFLLPVLVLLALPAFVLIKGKENFRGIEQILEKNEPILYGYAYNQENYSSVKFNTLKRQKFDVVALGSSRVLQFRQQMFSSSFYNAGFTLNSILHFKAFLELLPKENYPKVLIIGLDQNFFNPNWVDLEQVINPRRWTNSFTKNPSYKVYLKVYQDLMNEKYSLSQLSEKARENVFGLDAVLNGNGFRLDGSSSYKKEVERNMGLDPINFDTIFKRDYQEIENDAPTSYRGAAEVSLEALEVLKELLQFCTENKIQVIGFLPPFADEVYTAMINRGTHDYLTKLPKQLDLVFKSSDHEFYDFSTASLAHSTDLEMLDGFHGSEVAYARMLLMMTKEGKALEGFVNYPILTEELANSINRYMLYGY